MSRITKRPQNMCYNCGSRSTGIDLGGIVLLVILVIVLFLILH